MVSSSLFRLKPFVVGVILVMGIATYVTKAGGLWLLGRVDVSDRVEAGLEVLPGAIVVSILGPTLVDAGPAGWSAAAVALLVAWRSESVLLTIIAGVGAVVFLRAI
jgi:uncharacterized membrane protein